MYKCCMYNTSVDHPLTGGCIAAKVRRVGRVIVRLYDDALREHGLTVAQLDMLATLLELGGRARPSELASALLAERSTITRNVARLERLGLVASSAAAHGRETTVQVTSAGEQAAICATSSWEAAQRKAAELLAPGGIAALDLLVDRINQAKGAT